MGRTTRSRRRLALLVVPILAFGAAGLVADWFGPILALRHPLLQISLDPKIRYLALTAHRVGTVPWFLIGLVRLTVTDPFWYLLGSWYGEESTGWIERNIGGGRLIRLTERWFSRLSWLFVIIVPDGLVCLLAGATDMPPIPFALLDLAGTIGRLVVVTVLAQALAGPISETTRFIASYQWWLVAMSVGIGGCHVMRRAQAARRTGP